MKTKYLWNKNHKNVLSMSLEFLIFAYDLCEFSFSTSVIPAFQNVSKSKKKTNKIYDWITNISNVLFNLVVEAFRFCFEIFISFTKDFCE